MDSPPVDEKQRFINSSQEEEAILQEWCSQEHVSLLTDTLNVSDGSQKDPGSFTRGSGMLHVLHIDIARPYIESHEGHHYFFVGALRLPNQPLMIDIRLLKTRTSVEVCAALERMTSLRAYLSKDLRSRIHPASRDPQANGTAVSHHFRTSTRVLGICSQ